MDAWEHKFISVEMDASKERFEPPKEIDQLGREGWKVVTCSSIDRIGNTLQVLLVLRRPLSTDKTS
jgi:hypothetical protein